MIKAMSIDALREALRKWHLEAKQDLAEASANDVDEKESAYLAGRISAYEEVLAALAAPASETLEKKYATGLQWAAANPEDAKEMLEAVRPSETEKLPAKWRERYVKHHRGDEECCCCSMCAIELEAALKADWQGK